MLGALMENVFGGVEVSKQKSKVELTTCSLKISTSSARASDWLQRFCQVARAEIPFLDNSFFAWRTSLYLFNSLYQKSNKFCIVSRGYRKFIFLFSLKARRCYPVQLSKHQRLQKLVSKEFFSKEQRLLFHHINGRDPLMNTYRSRFHGIN
jgi:hypothetical protein